MMPKRSVPFLLIIGALFASVPLGCNLILGSGYVVGGEDSGAGPDSSTANQDSGASGDTGAADTFVADTSCAIVPEHRQQFESACTNAACQPFDNTRDTNCDGGGTNCPVVAAPEAGATDSGQPNPPAPPDGGVLCSSLLEPGALGPAGGALPQPVIFATGSTAIQPYMGRIAQVLESLPTGGLSVVYYGASSCNGVNAMLNGLSMYEVAALNAPTTAPQATYYDSNLNPSTGALQSGTCYFTPTDGILANLGVSDVFATTCFPDLNVSGGLPNNLHDFFGPVQTMELMVPVESSQQSISSQAAYSIFGYGNASGVAPWTNTAFIQIRTSTSGTQNMIGEAINLPAAQWQGTQNKSSTNVVTALTNVNKGLNVDGGAGDPSYVQASLGILASDVADSNRQNMRPLAFQDIGESCGWYPDSTATAYDKQNVRDGHYPIWGPSHLIAAVNSSTTPTIPGVQTLIDSMNGSYQPVLSILDVIGFYGSSHIIPNCAMHVQRSQDGQDYQPYAPVVSCSCYYDYVVSTTSCTPCTTTTDCADAGANYACQIFGTPPKGFCEPVGSQ